MLLLSFAHAPICLSLLWHLAHIHQVFSSSFHYRINFVLHDTPPFEDFGEFEQLEFLSILDGRLPESYRRPEGKSLAALRRLMKPTKAAIAGRVHAVIFLVDARNYSRVWGVDVKKWRVLVKLRGKFAVCSILSIGG